VIIDDLSRDPKVRKMITDQTQSVINEAAAELRESSEGPTTVWSLPSAK
jgi:hypothetical protein